MVGALLEIEATDDDLVEAVRRGDADAFRRLVDRHRDWLTARCRRHLGGDAHAAEDIAQECLVALQRALVTKDAPMRVRPWLTVVARNRCIDETRKRRAVPTAAVPDEAVFDPEVGGEDELLARAWGALTGRHRRVLELRELSGLSYDEIAASLAVTSGAVEALLFRARTALRREYARAGGKVASMVPMQEAVARATGNRGLLSELVDRTSSAVAGSASSLSSGADVLGGASAADAAAAASSTSALSSADGGLGLVHELQARLLGLPGADSLVANAGTGRLRAAIATVALLLGGAGVVAGNVAVDPSTSSVPPTPPPSVISVPEAPSATAPTTPSPATTPDAPSAGDAPSAPATPDTPSATAPQPTPPTVGVPATGTGLTVPGVTIPLPVPVTVPSTSITVPPVVPPTLDGAEAVADQVGRLLRGLLTSPG